jgi:spore coat polysaccharide biosynthesis protein SpsF
MRTGLIIFSRYDSRRLPGKALRNIVDRPLLGHVLDRARHARDELTNEFDDEFIVVVATSARAIDDRIATFAMAEGVDLYRGAAHDVAGRALACAEKHGLSRFIRICGDSPFFDLELVGRLLTLARKKDLDLSTNVFPRSFPVGTSIEVISTSAMKRVVEVSRAPEDREHITRYIYGHPEEFRIENLPAGHSRYHGVTLSVDDPEDLARATWIVENLAKPVGIASLDEVVALARAWDSSREGGTQSPTTPRTQWNAQ